MRNNFMVGGKREEVSIKAPTNVKLKLKNRQI